MLNAFQNVINENSSAAMLQSTPTLNTTDADGDTESSDIFSDLHDEQLDQPHLKYLQNSSCELDMINKHPAVKSVFLRFTSTIPSSAQSKDYPALELSMM